MFKRIFLGLLVLVVALVAVVATKTFLLKSRDVQVAASDKIDIDDQAAASAQPVQVNLECGRVQRDQYIRIIAMGLYMPRSKIDLKRRNTKCRTDGRANFSWKIWECR